MDIWAECRDRVSSEPLANELIRVVESQEQVAIHSLVDNLQEQDALEKMLEQTKPAAPVHTDKLHYLLVTPFRYPPLQFGSRFGSRFEPSLLYGSHTVATALAESGYYRFLFWLGMSVPPPSGKFVTQHTVFGVAYKTDQGLKLQNEPFSEYEADLTHPGSYAITQKLGTAMRDFGIEAFEYLSARDKKRSTNAALFTPLALVGTRPLFQQPWLCELNSQRVSFYSSASETVYQFPLDDFLIKGVFPQPAG